MKFDIKDVKSWKDRYDVKVGDEGYFGDNIEDFKIENRTRMITEILDDHAFCFSTPTNRYSFFLPLDAVKEEKKKYRPFKDLYELYDFLSFSPFTKKDFRNEFLLRFSFTYREKSVPQVTTMAVITRIDVDSDNDPCSIYINNINLECWFNGYELMNRKGEWVPFGVEVKND